MKNFFTGNEFKIFIALLLIMCGLILYSVSEGTSFFLGTLDYIVTPVQGFFTYISNSASDFFSSGRIRELEDKANALEDETRKLREVSVDYYRMKNENEKFIKYFDIKQRNQSLKFVSSSVIGRDSVDDYFAFTLDVGTLSNIAEGMPVITENGLVGYVNSVGTESCKVKTILSPQVKVGALDVVTTDNGVITGSAYFADQNKTKLTFLPAQNTVSSGDIVVTSGFSGMFPKNLPIGTVIEKGYDASDGTFYCTVQPFEDIKNIRSVFIITDFSGKE